MRWSLTPRAFALALYLRYSLFDKYFKKIGNCVGPATCPAGTGKDTEHYLVSCFRQTPA